MFLGQYKKLLDDYDKEIDAPGWDIRLLPLLHKMNNVWDKLLQSEQQLAVVYTQQLYAKRIE